MGLGTLSRVRLPNPRGEQIEREKKKKKEARGQGSALQQTRERSGEGLRWGRLRFDATLGGALYQRGKCEYSMIS